MKFEIPYGRDHLTVNIPKERVKNVLLSNIDKMRSDQQEDDIVKTAMAFPIASAKLHELAIGKKTGVVIISDHTRPVPSKHIVPFLLEEMRHASPDMDIILLVATGCHRQTNIEELREKLGEEILSREHIVVHDCEDEGVTIGRLPSGGDLTINQIVAQADLVVAEGFIEPHFFAGFSGGRKSILPGVCERSVVLGNHCSHLIDSPFARTGILDQNPIHEDMVAAARMAKLSYIVNVVIDEDKKIVAAFAGDAIHAHRAGCKFLEEYCRVPAAPADIVITSNGGAPLDQNIYQCVKGLTTAEASAKEDAVIIICGECADGIGGDSFYTAMCNCCSPASLRREVTQIPQNKTVPDQWQYQILARVLENCNVIFVTRPELAQIIRDMKMTYAADLKQALEIAEGIKGKDAQITIIPNGISVMVDRK